MNKTIALAVLASVGCHPRYDWSLRVLLDHCSRHQPAPALDTGRLQGFLLLCALHDQKFRYLLKDVQAQMHQCQVSHQDHPGGTWPILRPLQKSGNCAEIKLLSQQADTEACDSESLTLTWSSANWSSVSWELATISTTFAHEDVCTRGSTGSMKQRAPGRQVAKPVAIYCHPNWAQVSWTCTNCRHLPNH